MLQPTPSTRITSIDILRGLVMVIMALDHTRDFVHIDAMRQDPLDLQTTTGILFFTRWITHFCAPIFLLLSGISAGISGQRHSLSEKSTMLIKRGLWLLLIEVVVMALGLSFDLSYSTIFFQVIWAIGGSMIFLGLILRLSTKLVLPMALMLILGHDLLTYLPPIKDPLGNGIIQLLFLARFYIIPLAPGHVIAAFYPVLPWAGIMLLGYAISAWFRPEFDVAKRRSLLLRSGTVAIALFIILRLINHYGDPRPWSVQDSAFKTSLSFINVSKYPPSLLYTCITVGTGLLFLAATEKVNTWWSRILTVYGKVPFFYYIPHFYLIHAVGVIIFFAQGYRLAQAADPNLPFMFRRVDMGLSLGYTYLIWIAVVAALYLPCKWYAGYKQTHRDQWWTRYI